ncbi:hypothetical protein KDA_43870 [Dictyobacter alpinus]|uniref:Uncharacterized protein n=1 Tax=Dictyobacter alpinus TaxID=2014873 RepID=A0A402BBZ2_9CHLR|nr:hypothetical protein [Dictyobacter alpinus]GCE28903.1 hypothetical protein KDA_43870 [Dictyobacter alpinus]
MDVVNQELAQVVKDTLQEITKDVVQGTAALNRQPFVVSHHVEVALADDVATLKASQIQETTLATTARALFNIWKERRHNEFLSKGENVAMLIEEIIRMGRDGHLQSEATTKSSYTHEQREQVIANVQFLANFYVVDTSTLTYHDQNRTIAFNGPYLHVSVVNKVPANEIVGFYIQLAPWVSTYRAALQQETSKM